MYLASKYNMNCVDFLYSVGQTLVYILHDFLCLDFWTSSSVTDEDEVGVRYVQYNYALCKI